MKAQIDEIALAKVLWGFPFKPDSEEYITNADWLVVEQDEVINGYIQELAKDDECAAVSLTEEAMGYAAIKSLALSRRTGLGLDLSKSIKEVLRHYIMPGIKSSVSGAYEIYMDWHKGNREIGE